LTGAGRDDAASSGTAGDARYAPSALIRALGQLANPEQRRAELQKVLLDLQSWGGRGVDIDDALRELRRIETQVRVLDVIVDIESELSAQRLGVKAPGADSRKDRLLRLEEAVLRERRGNFGYTSGRLEKRYTIDWSQPLGCGGFGAVYGGIRLLDGRAVVVKLAHEDEDGAAPRNREAFLWEQAVLSRLDRHPVDDVVQLLEVGEERGRLYLVLEKVHGVTLSDVLDGFPDGLPPAVALYWALQLLEILHDVHRQGVVHSDLKPANLMVRWFPDDDDIRAAEDDPSRLTDLPPLVLVDLGAAVLLDEARSGSNPHTPDYAAYEQLRGGGVHRDTEPDIHGAASVLVELFVGRTARLAVMGLLDRLAGGGGASKTVVATTGSRRTDERSSGRPDHVEDGTSEWFDPDAALERIPPPVQRALAPALHWDVRERECDASTLHDVLLRCFAEVVDGMSSARGGAKQ